MAIYEYQCGSCGKKSEISHGMKEPPRTKCPKCGKDSLTRMISSGLGLIFRGTGFWTTDYKNKK